MSTVPTTVKELIEEALEKIGVPAQVSEQKPSVPGQGNTVFHIEVSENSHLIIGAHGVNLDALQHLLRLLVRRRFGNDLHFSIDVNGYWTEKSSTLIREAFETAETVSRNRSAHILRPMTAFERKIVHTALAEHPGVITESLGSGEQRKVVIKPAPLISE